jgi:antitoxin component of MazEF toxin-antitoxin module
MMIVKALSLQAGDQVALELRDDGMFIKKKQSMSQMFEEFYGKPFDEITQNDLSPAKEINWGEDVGSEVINPTPEK